MAKRRVYLLLPPVYGGNVKEDRRDVWRDGRVSGESSYPEVGSKGGRR